MSNLIVYVAIDPGNATIKTATSLNRDPVVIPSYRDISCYGYIDCYERYSI